MLMAVQACSQCDGGRGGVSAAAGERVEVPPGGVTGHYRVALQRAPEGAGVCEGWSLSVSLWAESAAAAPPLEVRVDHGALVVDDRFLDTPPVTDVTLLGGTTLVPGQGAYATGMMLSEQCAFGTAAWKELVVSVSPSPNAPGVGVLRTSWETSLGLDEPGMDHADEQVFHILRWDALSGRWQPLETRRTVADAVRR